MSDDLRQVDYSGYLAAPTHAERELLRLYSPAQPLVIFDIGACEGEETIRYSRRFPQARLFAFEPLPANQSLVRANFARYTIANAELVPLALADRPGEATFHVSSGRPPHEFSGADWNYGNKSSSLLPPADATPMHGWIEFKGAITVQTDTLDNFCRERGIDRIDFVHMDVQGAEHLVLSGAAATLPRIGALWLEVAEREFYRGQKLRHEIQALLRRRGFALALDARRAGEGDQFYVNLRRPQNWPYLLRRKLGRAALRLRQAARDGNK